MARQGCGGIDNKQRIVDGSTNVEGCDGWSFISVNVAEVLWIALASNHCSRRHNNRPRGGAVPPAFRSSFFIFPRRNPFSPSSLSFFSSHDFNRPRKDRINRPSILALIGNLYYTSDLVLLARRDFWEHDPFLLLLCFLLRRKRRADTFNFPRQHSTYYLQLILPRKIRFLIITRG